MAWLEIISGSEQGTQLEVHPGVFKIGRQSGCDLKLTDSKVSRFHAQLEFRPDGSIFIIDQNSSNGTFVQGKRITAPTPINTGDTFQVGDTQIRIKIESEYIPSPALSPKRGLDLSSGYYLPPGGATRSLQLKEDIITIGRDSSNTITINHPMVSRFHARITGSPAGYFLQDLNSVNGTYVNGNRVSGLVELKPRSLVQICGYRYYFDGHNLEEYQETAGQMAIEISNLGKTIRLPDGKTRTLLNNINLVIEPQEFVAILGGSGAGKSTLLGALTGMKPATAGEITINGRDFYREYDVFRSLIGYVPQDDIVHLDLTVAEVLTYSARLRMPDDTSDKEIASTVNRVMKDLELTERADVLVRNLSGGQRKRVSIGVELLTSPSLLFLDEPTSGLDPGLEKVMMEMFRKLANQGQTVFLVTHATFNVHLCDKVIFLTEGGELAFFGSPNEALAYFGAHDFAEIYQKLTTGQTPQKWAQAFRESREFQNNVVRKRSAENSHAKSLVAREAGSVSAPAVRVSPFKQWAILSSRYTRIMTRDTRNLALLILQPIIIGLLFVLVFHSHAPLFEYSKYQSEDTEIAEQALSPDKAEQNRARAGSENKRRSHMSICVAVMVFTAIWLGTSNSAREIVKERAIYERERLVNLKITPYLMSKVVILLIICFLQTLIFLGIIKVGLGLEHFWPNVWAFLMISFASVMMGLVVSAMVSNADKAVSAVPILLVPQIILSGAIVPISEVKPEVLQYVFYPAISKWGYELVAGGILDINNRVALVAPLDALEGSFTGHWWIIAGFAVVFYIICKITMVRERKEG